MPEIGKIRRSQVISTYGPGAIIDFRSPLGAPVSAVSGGLEDWEALAIRKGLANDQVIYEPRLQHKLQVDGFRLPPVGKEYTGGKDKTGRLAERDRQIAALRFPNWHVCPNCEVLQPTAQWRQDPGTDELSCPACSGKPGGPPRQFVVPVRFVVACENGHLSEFPWKSWCEHKEGCDRSKPLSLVSSGAGLGKLAVRCDGCGGQKSMGSALSKTALTRIGHSCSGQSPWLPKLPEACDCVPMAIQRGASNAYFPIVESAIDIPPWGDSFQEALGNHWRQLTKLDDRSQIRDFVKNYIMDDWVDVHLSLDDMVARITLRLDLIKHTNTENLRIEEYAHLTAGQLSEVEADRTSFQIRPEAIPQRWDGMLAHVVRVERLREVRALKGFSRLTPFMAEVQGRKMAPLSMQPRKWLPAVEVFGEGIFLAFNETALQAWESQPAVLLRIATLRAAALREWKARNGEVLPMPTELSARFLLLHTLSHAFIRRLSLDCGYSSASVRERLYVGAGDQPMAGFLVYTSAPDSDGTLGGLSRQGRSDRAGATLMQAIRDMEWCASDPLCSSGINALSDYSNLAACHCCSFLPETACEHFNHYLDRALLVGLPDDPDLGFFTDSLRQDR